jgi:hypothetical protein
MSSNYFKQPQQYNRNSNTNTNTNSNSNGFKSFNSSSSSSSSAEVVPVFVPKESDFPELVPTKKKPSVNVSVADDAADSKYSNIAASNTETKTDGKIIIPDGCTQITIHKKTRKSDIRVGKTKPTPLQEELVIDTIIYELEKNWNKYQTEYDSIHGEGAYIEAHYMEPVYPFLDEEYETESDYSDYSAETDMDNV